MEVVKMYERPLIRIGLNLDLVRPKNYEATCSRCGFLTVTSTDSLSPKIREALVNKADYHARNNHANWVDREGWTSEEVKVEISEEQETCKVVETLVNELDKHGYGDFHYKYAGKDQDVIDALAVGRAWLEAHAKDVPDVKEDNLDPIQSSQQQP
jgi:hypothetical protein